MPFGAAGLVLLTAPFLPGGTVGGLLSFAGVCAGLSLSNGTAPMAAMVMDILPSEAQSAGLALWNSGANLGGYAGPAVFGWLLSLIHISEPTRPY